MTTNYSPNFSLPKRSKNQIKFIILHYTGMKKETLAIKKLCNSNSKVSAHYFIKNNGKLLNFVPDLYEAWHAGKSSWKTYKFLNKYSIGVEINNTGHNHGYRKFKKKQIFTLNKLLRYLIEKYNINYKNILGHSDIAPDRKKDPGEKFPWKYLAKKKIGIWHSLDESKLLKSRGLKINKLEKKIYINNLIKIGYNLSLKKITKIEKKKI